MADARLRAAIVTPPKFRFPGSWLAIRSLERPVLENAHSFLLIPHPRSHIRAPLIVRDGATYAR